MWLVFGINCVLLKGKLSEQMYQSKLVLKLVIISHFTCACLPAARLILKSFVSSIRLSCLQKGNKILLSHIFNFWHWLLSKRCKNAVSDHLLKTGTVRLTHYVGCQWKRGSSPGPVTREVLHAIHHTSANITSPQPYEISVPLSKDSAIFHKYEAKYGGKVIDGSLAQALLCILSYG